MTALRVKRIGQPEIETLRDYPDRKKIITRRLFKDNYQELKEEGIKIMTKDPTKEVCIITPSRHKYCIVKGKRKPFVVRKIY